MYIWILSHHFQVLEILKEKPYKVDLADHFLNVDTLLVGAFQIAIRNWRKQAKSVGEGLPASKRHGKARWSQGDGAQGMSTVEILEKKQGELEERRKRRRDETVRALLLFCCLC